MMSGGAAAEGQSIRYLTATIARLCRQVVRTTKQSRHLLLAMCLLGQFSVLG
jgi:hypothetical protein